MYTSLMNKIQNNKELIGVLGLGYVGLPLAVEFALKGANVLGFEKNENKAKDVNAGKNYIGDVTDSDREAAYELGGTLAALALEQPERQ